MTYTSDQQLRELGLKPLADIPNREGFKLMLVTRDELQSVAATVRKHHVTQTHYCAYSACFIWSDFIGWRPA